MLTIFDKILILARQLFPTGRAFNVHYKSVIEGLEKAFASSEERLYNDSVSILDSSLPDNENFTADDATAWEARLGLITNTAVYLEDRKSAILRKLQFPGTAKARLSQTWFQSQLQAAGFDVYVYENLDNASPFFVSGASSILSNVEYGQRNYGQARYGGFYNNKLVNHLPEGADDNFNAGGTFKTSLIIGGPTLGSFANVNIDRKEEFRQLILRLKPGTYVAYLFINYNY